MDKPADKTLDKILRGLGLSRDIERIKQDVYNRVMEKIAPDELRSRILTIKTIVDVSYFELGGYLYWVHKKSFWKDWGYKRWRDYVEKEVGFSIRKVEYLERIWFWIDALDLPVKKKKELVAIGWDKNKEVAGIVNEKNVDRVIKLAKETPSIEFKQRVKEEFLKKPQPGSQHRFSIILWEDQNETVRDAIDKAREIANTDKIGHALSLICLSYLSEVVDLKNWRDAIVRLFIKYEKILGIKILAVGPDEKVLYKTKGFGEKDG